VSVVLITGGSAGIGREIAQALARAGWCVFATSRRPQDAAPLPGVVYLPLDLHDPQSIHDCVQTVLARAGRIDALVNNAGLIGIASASEEASMEQVRQLFETNFFGVVSMVNAVLPVLRRQGGGHIVNISSALGLVVTPSFFSFYAASKHALEGYTEGLRYEVRPFNIRVALVEPGFTSTEIGETILPPQRPLDAYAETRQRVTRLDQAGIRYGAPPEDVARLVVRILNHPNPGLRHLSGADSQAILLLKRFLPYAVFERIVEFVFLSWRPRARGEGTPSLEELGAHRLLFHHATLKRILQAALAAAGALSLLGLAALRKKAD
jgi:NAD(P)-dependent dehydrogenase (short-subunit alcohol dehydrogenase family)